MKICNCISLAVVFSNESAVAKTTLLSWVENCWLRRGGVINKQALEDSTAVLEIQQGACNSCSPYQGAIYYCSKHAEVPFLSVQVIRSSLHFFYVCVMYLYLAWAKEDTSIWPDDQRSKAFIHFFHDQPYQLGFGKSCHIFCKRLAAMLSEKRDSHTTQQNDGVDMFATWAWPAKSHYIMSIRA